MTESEWGAIADRLGAAWPPFPPERRAVYLDVLADLPAGLVLAAVEVLLREDRNDLPSPGTIRQRALSLAPAAERTATAPEPAPSPVPLPPEVPKASAETRSRPPGMAIASLVCGLAGLLLVPVVCSVLGIVFGQMALRQIEEKQLPGERMAGWGLALGIFSLAVWTSVLIFFSVRG